MQEAIRKEMTGGIIQINLDENRYYEIAPGEYVPSITTILNAYPKGYGFNKWLASLTSYEESQKILHKAGDRGSHVHNAIETLLSGEELNYTDHPYGSNKPFTPEEWKFVLSFMNWFEKTKPIVKSIEETVYGQGWAGTVDLVCKIDNKPVIVDWKTSSAIHESHKCQIAAYATAHGIDEARIIRLGSRHKCGYEEKILSADDIKKYYALFENVRAIWKHENPNPHPRFLEVPEKLSLLDLFNVEGENVA